MKIPDNIQNQHIAKVKFDLLSYHERLGKICLDKWNCPGFIENGNNQCISLRRNADPRDISYYSETR